jgi:copper chaperone CopZ
MRRATIVTGVMMVTAAGLSLIAGGCASTASEDPTVLEARVSDEPIAESEVLLTVYGMSCPLCANNVDNTLLSVPGVEDVSLDMGTGIAVVRLDGRTPVTRRQLAAAVDRSGFSLQRVETR